MEEYCNNPFTSEVQYDFGIIPVIMETTAPYRDNYTRTQMERVFNQKISQFREAMEDASEMGDNRSANYWSLALKDIIDAKANI